VLVELGAAAQAEAPAPGAGGVSGPHHGLLAACLLECPHMDCIR
jgi:hypothetical protein